MPNQEACARHIAPWAVRGLKPPLASGEGWDTCVVNTTDPGVSDTSTGKKPAQAKEKHKGKWLSGNRPHRKYPMAFFLSSLAVVHFRNERPSSESRERPQGGPPRSHFFETRVAIFILPEPNVLLPETRGKPRATFDSLFHQDHLSRTTISLTSNTVKIDSGR